MSTRYVTHHALNAMIVLKRKLLADADLAMKASGCSSIVVAHYIDEIINGVLRTETELIDTRRFLDAQREYVAEYEAMFCDYTVNMLNDARKVELRALVEKWEKEDAEEDAEERKAIDNEPGAITFEEARRNGWR